MEYRLCTRPTTQFHITHSEAKTSKKRIICVMLHKIASVKSHMEIADALVLVASEEHSVALLDRGKLRT